MTTTQDGGSAPASKVMRLRYAGPCDRCGTAIETGTRALYLKDTRTVRCLTCSDGAGAAGPSLRVERDPAPAPGHVAAPAPAPEPGPVASGTAGSSARREYERRSANREARIRDAHPRLGGLILALTDEPQSIRAWARGARGEEMLAAGLGDLAAKGVLLLHDRRIPRTRANIDHLAITTNGVHVIDAKRYAGRPTLRVEGGFIRPRVERLVVGSRDGTKLVEGMHKQTGLVRRVLDDAGFVGVPVHGALCFVDADWPLFGGSFMIEGVAVLWPRKLGGRLLAPGDLSAEEVHAAHRALGQAFPIA